MVPCLRIGLRASRFSHIYDTSLLWISSIMICVTPETLGYLGRSGIKSRQEPAATAAGAFAS